MLNRVADMVRFWKKGRSKMADRKTRLGLETLEERCVLSTGLVQTNLVSDIQGLAQTTDANLINPWGLTAAPGGPFWVSNNNSGTSTLYSGQGTKIPLTVTIPTNTITTPPTLGSPSGTVANTFAGFDVTPGGKSAAFLFDTEDGNIDAWAGGNTATMEVNNPSAGYKGLTEATDAAGDNLLYAANFAQGTIDVFDKNFQLVQGAPGSNAKPSPITLKGTFTDPNLPAGFAPFNIQEVNGLLYVEYAKFDPTTTEGQRGQGLGFVDVYNADGQLVNPNGQNHLISGGVLNAPWGVAMAPSNFGQFSNDLLVGNFGDGHINAFNPTTGAFLGQLTLANGQPFQEDNLWAIQFGNGAINKATGQVAAPTNTLYFTAGIENQQHGLFGSLQATATVSANSPVLPNLPTAAAQNVSTVPANGDQNPYGAAFVPQGIHNGGMLQSGDLLVSNFNNNAASGGVQGTGSTIELITPDGGRQTFFNGSTALPGQPLGLTDALAVLKSGFVLVGNVPTNANGVAQQGSLLILDGNGNVVENLTSSKLLDGPWGLTVNDQGVFAQVFVSNVLSGTITRIDLLTLPGQKPLVLDMVQIASGYATGTSPTALVVGPTGLAFNPKNDTLYVASTADNAIFAVPNAAITFHDRGTGTAVVQNSTELHGPLGLVLAPNGDLIVSNGDAIKPGGTPNDLVEFDPSGNFVGSFQLDTGNPGAAFGLALTTQNGELRFAAVDDNTNSVQIFTLGLTPGHSHHHGHDDDGQDDDGFSDWF
jgi:uncharacterized protein (TIGR03118 family)